MRGATSENIIKRLRSEIPRMECRPGCSDCCGPIFFSAWEWSQVRDKRQATSPDAKCPYVNTDGRCDIYEQRPIVCRLFGTVKTGIMACPYGCIPANPLTEEEVRRIATDWMDVIDK